LPSELSGVPAAAASRSARALRARARGAAVRRPLSNLDARLRRSMREEIRALQQRLGLTVAYVNHDRARRWR
jgi:iron(III) transport system ATP-binding protein